MIERINNYALTSAQPGVINEEAFTVLELVGKCGRKVNDCIDQVNENTQLVNENTELAESYETRVTTLEGKARTAETAIAGLTSDVEDHETRIDDLESEIDDLESETETQQAAISTLQTTTTTQGENITILNNRDIDKTRIYGFTPFSGSITEQGGDEYTDTFCEYIADLIAGFMNANFFYYTFNEYNPFPGNASVGNFETSLIDFEDAGQIRNGLTTGTLKFKISAGPLIGIITPGNYDPIVNWEFTQTVWADSGITGTFNTIYACGSLRIPAGTYNSTQHPYDGQLFKSLCYGPHYEYDFQV